MKTISIITFSLLLFPFIAKPQVADSITQRKDNSEMQPMLSYSPEFPDHLNKKSLWVTAATEAVLYTGELTFLNTVWWGGRGETPVDFFFHNDNAGYLQIDKCGHFTTAYNESRLAYYFYRKTGLSKKSSILIGGLTGFALQLPIEIWDGFYEKWGFSWGDISANTLGACLFAGQEYFFDDQIVKMKFSYWRSSDAQYAPQALGSNFFESMSDDYNSHTYWLSANLSKIFPESNIPPWLSVAAGYSIDHVYGEYNNHYCPEIPNSARTRQFLLSLDVDWDKIPTHSRFLKYIFQGLDIIKMPFPAVEYNSQGKFRGYWFYF